MVAALTSPNRRIVIVKYIISVGANVTHVRLVEDTGGTPADLTQRFFSSVGDSDVTWRTLETTAGNNLGVTSVGTGDFSVSVEYYPIEDRIQGMPG